VGATLAGHKTLVLKFQSITFIPLPLFRITYQVQQVISQGLYVGRKNSLRKTCVPLGTPCDLADTAVFNFPYLVPDGTKILEFICMATYMMSLSGQIGFSPALLYTR
jgi:hypothetical protein